MKQSPREILRLAGDALDQGDGIEAELLMFLAIERGATDEDVSILSPQNRRKLQKIFRRRIVSSSRETC